MSRVTGVDYGAGLLQLWVGQGCYEGESGSDHFRLIPTSDVSFDQIAAIPHEISDDYFYSMSLPPAIKAFGRTVKRVTVISKSLALEKELLRGMSMYITLTYKR